MCSIPLPDILGFLGSEKVSKFGNFRANLVEFRIQKVNFSLYHSPVGLSSVSRRVFDCSSQKMTFLNPKFNQICPKIAKF